MFCKCYACFPFLLPDIFPVDVVEGKRRIVDVGGDGVGFLPAAASAAPAASVTTGRGYVAHRDDNDDDIDDEDISVKRKFFFSLKFLFSFRYLDVITLIFLT